MSINNQPSILRKILSVSGVVILAKFLGFFKQVITASYFGATIQTDLISLSEGLVSNIDYMLVQALSTAFVPTYITISAKEPVNRKRFTANVLVTFLTITFLIFVLLFITAPVVAKILAPTYDAVFSLQLVKYIRIYAPAILWVVELAVFNALLRANERFLPGELISCNQSVIMILLILSVGSCMGPDILVLGFYIYTIFNLCFLMVYSRKYWTLSLHGAFADPSVKQLLIMMGPLLLGYSMVFVNQQVDRIIVSGLGVGIVTAMGYAAVLSNFVGTFVGSICGVTFTYISQNIAEHKEQDAAKLITSTSIWLITLFLPISVLTVANSSDIVTIVFQHGKFDETAVMQCAIALSGYGLMFVALVLREQFSRFQYAYGDSKRPMINSSIAIVFNIIFSILLSRLLGVLGVTLATSLSVLICAILNIRSSIERNSNLRLSALLQYLPQWLIGIIICLGVSFLGQKYLNDSGSLIRFLGVTILSFALYGIVVWQILRPFIIQLNNR